VSNQLHLSPSFANKPSSNAMSQSKPLYTLGRSILIFGKVITSPILSLIYQAAGAKEKCDFYRRRQPANR
jgi:hypothetical protein